MRTFRSFAASSVFAAVAAGLLVTGCSAEVHVGKTEPKLSAGKLSDTVAQKLADQTGRSKPKVDCPDDLKGKVGTTTRCTLTADDGSTVGVAVKVTSVDGSDINFHIQVDDAASPAQN